MQFKCGSDIFCRSLKGIHAEIGLSVLRSFAVTLIDHFKNSNFRFF